MSSSGARRGGTPPPSYVSSALNTYDPVRSVYNWQAANTRKIRASLARAASGAGLANWLVIGDSETDSYVGTGYAQASMWPVALQSTIAALGIPSAGIGWVKAGGSSPTADPRITTTGSWTRTQPTYPWPFASSTTAGGGDTMTLASPAACTIAGVKFYDSGNANLAYSVKDGGGNVLTSGNIAVGNSGAFKTQTFPGLVGARTITVTTAVPTNIVALGMLNASGLLVTNSAQYGTKAAGGAQSGAWADPAPLYNINWPTPWLPANTSTDVVFCALGVNDILGGANAGTVAAALSTLRGYWPNADFVLVAQYQPAAVSLATWQAYVSALYSIADTLNVPLIDLLDRSGGYATANANGLMGDGTHPNLGAQFNWGRAIGLQAAA